MRVDKFFFYFVGTRIGCGMRGGGNGSEGGAPWRSVMDLKA